MIIPSPRVSKSMDDFSIMITCCIIQIYCFMLSPEQQERTMTGILTRKENSLCADCNGKSPCWASLDLGVFICMNCAGAHRALGPSVTRVKSTKLDTWHSDWVQKMKGGNTVVNEYWQRGLSSSNAQKPNINTSLEDIILFVKDKYLHRKYIDTHHTLDHLIKQANQVNNSTHRSQSVQINKHNYPKQIPKNNVTKQVHDSPFASFDTIIQNKLKQQKKSNATDNLISFDLQVQAKEKPPQKQAQKYNHSHFYSVSSKDNKADSKVQDSNKFINFDNLIKEKINMPQKNYQSNIFVNKQTQHQPYNFARHNIPSSPATAAKGFEHFDQYFLNSSKIPQKKPSIVGKKEGAKSWLDEWK